MSPEPGPWTDLDRPPLAVASLRSALLAPAGPLARLEVLPEVGSTNAELVRRAAADPDGWPAPALLTTDSQVAGRGRLGRTWEAPPRSGVALSLLLRPTAPPSTWSWLPLLAGVAVTGVLRDLAGLPAELKWPNDVLVEGRKACGLLVEVLPPAAGTAAPAGVVVGVGVNTTTRREELDAGGLDGATSLRLEGAATTDRDVLVRALVRALLGEVGRFEGAGGSAQRSGLAARTAEVCSTLGREVSVALPGGGVLRGTAEGLDDDGRLLVRGSDAGGGGGGVTAVGAGDVVHVR
ncbi:biotin--[acetyl-CoA-carboxylase] ligase [Quadrisphaera sp. INWT6]|uniref:biotin--[acetyl-CoA-carboxylase] ligase n=1 Tax=Quadrisphaera sp. INWT6 TaxID=2596917 RepID=UPI0018922C5B|nr:biotin--[acetyl-CoA-carboxylase] ligase [Quadrisphaera sp. INWT6]MBF5081528.1 biotin--[acetyl-CoA-carboxylase] ligase [Quadrisphaera sp. INWT6]